MTEEVGKETEVEGAGQGKGGAPWQGSEEPSASASIPISIPNTLGSFSMSPYFLPCPRSARTLHTPTLPAPTLLTGSWLAPGSSGHSSFWPLEV